MLTSPYAPYDTAYFFAGLRAGTWKIVSIQVVVE